MPVEVTGDKGAVRGFLPELFVGRMPEEAVGQLPDGILDRLAELFADAGAGFERLPVDKSLRKTNLF